MRNPCLLYTSLLKSSRLRRTAPLEEAERVAPPASGEVHEVWQAVERLPARERILVYLFYCEGYGLEAVSYTHLSGSGWSNSTRAVPRSWPGI